MFVQIMIVDHNLKYLSFQFVLQLTSLHNDSSLHSQSPIGSPLCMQFIFHYLHARVSLFLVSQQKRPQLLKCCLKCCLNNFVQQFSLPQSKFRMIRANVTHNPMVSQMHWIESPLQPRMFTIHYIQVVQIATSLIKCKSKPPYKAYIMIIPCHYLISTCEFIMAVSSVI